MPQPPDFGFYYQSNEQLVYSQRAAAYRTRYGILPVAGGLADQDPLLLADMDTWELLEDYLRAVELAKRGGVGT